MDRLFLLRFMIEYFLKTLGISKKKENVDYKKYFPKNLWNYRPWIRTTESFCMYNCIPLRFQTNDSSLSIPACSRSLSSQTQYYLLWLQFLCMLDYLNNCFMHHLSGISRVENSTGMIDMSEACNVMLNSLNRMKKGIGTNIARQRRL